MTGGYVLDDSVIEAYAHESAPVTRMITALEGMQIRTAVPAVALSLVMAHLADRQISEILGLVDILDHMEVAMIDTLDHVQHLGLVVRHMDDPLDVAAAHTTAVALHLDWPIITVDRQRWDVITAQLPYEVTVVELSDQPDTP